MIEKKTKNTVTKRRVGVRKDKTAASINIAGVSRTGGQRGNTLKPRKKKKETHRLVTGGWQKRSVVNTPIKSSGGRRRNFIE